MKRNNKKFLVLAAIIMIGLGLNKNVYAEWEKEGSEWKYLGDYGYNIGWEQIDGKWYYFTSGTGIMKIGWFYDEQYSKWYYLNFDGDMDGYKTTATYPVELSAIQDKIKNYTNEEVTYKCTNQIDSNVFMCFISNNESSQKQYYYHPSTGNVYEIKDGILTNLATNEVVNIFTEEQAVQVVKDYFSKNYKDIPQIIKVENDEGDCYLVHCYNDMDGYTANNSWYYVNKTTREVKSML